MKGYLDLWWDMLTQVRESGVTYGRPWTIVPTQLRLTFTGSREWPEEQEHVIDDLFRVTHQHWGSMVRLSHGAARGADRMADRLGRRRRWQIMPYRVSGREWDTYGGYAGHQRNARMLEAELPHLVLAMIHNRSRGATGCADNAAARGIPVLRVDDELALLASAPQVL